MAKKSNTVYIENGYYVIICNNGGNIKVDKNDFKKICGQTCYSHHGGASLTVNGKSKCLSTFLFPEYKGKVLHKNKDSLDFRRDNLFFGNSYTDTGEYFIGKCFDGKTYKIDYCDYELISPYVWHIDKNGYVITKHNGRVLKMHRLIMGIIDDEIYEVDHIYHDTCDNRRSVIRLSNRSLNCFNRRIMKNNTSGIAGVYWCSSANKWVAQITKDKFKRYLGVFNTMEDAIAARKQAEKLYY